MFSHEPEGYRCPFCLLLAGHETALNSRRDIVRQTELATALISPRWWPANAGHLLVIPNAHHENIYDLPADYGHAVHDLVRESAIALRAVYGCAGITVRQHNEPAGYQDVWHLHVHVLPRYPDDRLHLSEPVGEYLPAEQRWSRGYAIRAYFGAR